MPPKPQDVWDGDDDWAGILSQQERRKHQNRLHQRAYPCSQLSSPAPRKKATHITPRHRRYHDQPSTCHRNLPQRCHRQSFPIKVIDGSTDTGEHTIRGSPERIPLFILDPQQLRYHPKIAIFLQKATADWDAGRCLTADLPLLSRLNSFNALTRNAYIMNIPVDLLASDDGPSPFCLHGPAPPNAQAALPAHLAPTPLQRQLRHHPWLDLFPMPRFRDNVLEGMAAGILDEEDLSQQLLCELLDLDAVEPAALMIWGDSWDICQWEFSPDFFCKWAPLLAGCEEMLQATNYLRARRGEMGLTFILN